MILTLRSHHALASNREYYVTDVYSPIWRSHLDIFIFHVEWSVRGLHNLCPCASGHLGLIDELVLIEIQAAQYNGDGEAAQAEDCRMSSPCQMEFRRRGQGSGGEDA